MTPLYHHCITTVTQLYQHGNTTVLTQAERQLSHAARLLTGLSRELDSDSRDNPITIGFAPANIQLLSALLSLLSFLMYNDLAKLGFFPCLFNV
jgi:hypothetical protein